MEAQRVDNAQQLITTADQQMGRPRCGSQIITDVFINAFNLNKITAT